MKLIANLLLAISVAIGALAASTAYLAPLSLSDERLVGLTLNADAGRVQNADGSHAPLVERGRKLTAESLAALRANTVSRNGIELPTRYVSVKEFAFDRWRGRWMFLSALAGLLVGGLMMRSASKKELAEADAKASTAPPEESPEGAIRAVLATLDDLSRDMADIADTRARCQMIVQRVGELQVSHLPAFVEAKPRLIARMGLSSYAELMGHFSYGERMLNRAWSTAADGHIGEATTSLRNAREPLQTTAATLRA